MLVRIFAALEPDHKSRQALYDLALKAGIGRVIPAYDLHLTLSFFGETDDAERLKAAVRSVNGAEIRAWVGGRRTFGNARALIIEDGGAIAEIKRKFCLAAEFDDERKLLPHITVSRKDDFVSEPEQIQIRLCALTLFASENINGKREYTPLSSTFLKPERRFGCMLFDLDGTLTDSAPGIKRSLKYALDKLGIYGYDPEILNKFLGPPLVWSFKTYMGLDDDTAVRGLAEYRRNYNEMGGKYVAEVYPGVEKLLAALKEKGISLGVATVKPEKTACEVLEHFGLIKYFECVSGGQPDERKADKKSVIEQALKRIGKAAGEDVLMIGDRVYDIEGGISAGVKTLGVGYGFGGYAELREAGADYTAASATDILDLI